MKTFFIIIACKSFRPHISLIGYTLLITFYLHAFFQPQISLIGNMMWLFLGLLMYPFAALYNANAFNKCEKFRAPCNLLLSTSLMVFGCALLSLESANFPVYMVGFGLIGSSGGGCYNVVSTITEANYKNTTRQVVDCLFHDFSDFLNFFLLSFLDCALYFVVFFM
jgi:hypothetical protein